MIRKVIGIACAALTLICLTPVTSLAAVERYEVLVMGDEDEWVLELQQELSEREYLTVSPTGYYGTNTQNAVLKYQQDNGLLADGKAGPETRQHLFGDEYAAITDSRSIGGAQSQAVSASPAEEDASVTLLPGDKGGAISELQTRLKELEYYEYASITGYYGPVTTDAVQKFQRTHGLDTDGTMNSASMDVLYSDSAKVYMMYPGDKGDDIMKMQDRLRELGYFEVSSTGYYGNATLNSVRLFQENNGLAVDGKAGPNTRAVLYSADAKQSGVATPPADAGAAAETDSAEQQQPAAPVVAAEPTPTPEAVPTPQVPESPPPASAGVAKMIEVASSQEGKPYSYGAGGPNSFDCSGFVYYVLKNSGVATSRLSSASYAAVSNWTDVSDINSLAAGDLVCFKSDSGSNISHIGIYIGGGSFIHAAPSVGGVGISGMTSGYYLRNFVTAKRIY